MEAQKYSATIFFVQQDGQFQAKKYRNITRGKGVITFTNFAVRSGGTYINFYDQVSGKFITRRYLIQGEGNTGDFKPKND